MKKEREHKFDNEDALYQAVNLIFYTMVGVPLMVFLYLYLEIKDGKFFVDAPDVDLHLALLITIPIFILINVVLSYVFYERHIKSAQPTAQLRDKLQLFYKASLLKYSFLEAATIASLVGLFLTTELVYVILYLFVLLIYSLNRPTPFRFRKAMKIKTYPPTAKSLDKDKRLS
ncbi:MAG: hypothetical protein M3512_10960 [Bacteroidota bacterium]|nr:hypothetical protein [Bacteroidota bacterium]